jgi:hypothetical protein
MKLKTLASLSLLALAVGLVVSCKSEEPAQQGGYPQQTQPAGYNQPPAQPGYQPAPGAPAPAPAPAAAPLSAPGPLALPCTSDANCLTHHCNPQFGKCVFPCVADTDCITPNRCMAGACVPAAQ